MKSHSPTQTQSGHGRGALLAGGLAAILASTCCLGPLVLLTLGVSGVWIGNLAALEPFRPFFIGASGVALYFAWRRLFGASATCEPGQVCAVPHINRGYKGLFWLVVALMVTAFGFPLMAPWFY